MYNINLSLPLSGDGWGTSKIKVDARNLTSWFTEVARMRDCRHVHVFQKSTLSFSICVCVWKMGWNVFPLEPTNQQLASQSYSPETTCESALSDKDSS